MAIEMRSIQDVLAFFSRPKTGAAETGAAQGWHLLQHYLPEMRRVVIRRPVADVVRSLLALDIGPYRYDPAILWRNMRYGDRVLNRIEKLPGTISFDYADLETESACARIFEHCLWHEFDRAWWMDLRDKNIQCEVAPRIAYYQRHYGEVEGFKRVCKNELRRLVRSGAIN
jgi:hypothetical protein